MKKAKLFILLFSLIFAHCENEVELVNPQFTDGSVLENASKVPLDLQKATEGIYKVNVAGNKFGQLLVAKWNRGKLSFYGARLGIYFILNGGIKDSTLYLEGKWRYAVNTETGLVRLQSIKSANQLKLTGKYGDGTELPETEMELQYVRPFSDKVSEKEFFIIAHRAGGRNSDYVGASENSLEILPYAEHFGANGVEIDIKLSKDNIPFIYHDETINLRTTKDSPIWGDIENFTYKQLRAFVLLKNGERIPTLEEMLNYIIENTKLKFVWLDMKSDKNAMPFVIDIQAKALEKAKLLSRNINIVIGIPSEEKRDLLLKQPAYQNIPSLCELSIEDARKLDAEIWAPRWTLGTQTSSVELMHSENRLAFTWTLDQIASISEFIKSSKFDGILTNYPTIVSYFYYVQ